MAEETRSRTATRERVLESAVHVFAEKGFEAATIHEICERADANIAAVNYYFGSKEKLYAEAWRTAFRRSVEAHPPEGGVPADAPAEERLRGRIRAMVHRMADEDNQAFLIAQREMVSPTALLKEVRRECIRPLREQTQALVRELIGPDANDQTVIFCETSIVNQCMAVLRHRHHRTSGRSRGRAPRIRDLDAYAEHIARFSLAGLRAVRASLPSDADRCGQGGAD
ncbi:MAG: CerR family C-terminal domain-containing protein [Candidatus Brocadiia bacterium]